MSWHISNLKVCLWVQIQEQRSIDSIKNSNLLDSSLHLYHFFHSTPSHTILLNPSKTYPFKYGSTNFRLSSTSKCFTISSDSDYLDRYQTEISELVGPVSKNESCTCIINRKKIKTRTQKCKGAFQIEFTVLSKEYKASKKLTK